uniref:Uncharacterized protein n=1 Tax=Lepeophtheirus salmonis TaxID=72036 RepID=A0A0K2V6X6_LEPSM
MISSGFILESTYVLRENSPPSSEYSAKAKSTATTPTQSNSTVMIHGRYKKKS